MKKLFPILFLFVCSLSLSAQDTTQVHSGDDVTMNEKPKIKPYYGLIFGLSFGSYTSVNINPTIGFPITSKFSLGARVGYEYVKDTRYQFDQTWNNYGASAFARYRFIPQAYGHIEYAYYNYNAKSELGGESNFWVPFLYVGGGYVQPVGNNVAIIVEVLFDVLQDSNSPYGDWDPVISIGVQAGF